MEELGPTQRKLVRLFAEALLGAQEGRDAVWDRIRLVERIFDLSLHAMRRLSRDGSLGPEHLTALDRRLGVSAQWILSGNSEALAARIIEFCRDEPGEPEGTGPVAAVTQPAFPSSFSLRISRPPEPDVSTDEAPA